MEGSMKNKKLQPLKLSKQTVANLARQEQAEVKGGACTFEWSGCDTLFRPCCTVGLEWSCQPTMPPCV